MAISLLHLQLPAESPDSGPLLNIFYIYQKAHYTLISLEYISKHRPHPRLILLLDFFSRLLMNTHTLHLETSSLRQRADAANVSLVRE